MADIRKINTLPTMDMVSSERNTWYVVEWKNDQGDGECSVHRSEKERAKIVASLAVSESDIVVYYLLAFESLERDDIEGYISAGNSRLTY